MQLWILRAIYLLICAGAIATYVQPNAKPPELIERNTFAAFILLMMLTLSVVGVDLLIRRKKLDLISAIYFGLLIGTLLAYQLSVALKPVLPEIYHPLAQMLAVCMLPYLCISFLLQTRDDFRFVIPYVEFQKDVKGGRPLVIDSSSLIDGRIADVMDTGVFDTELLVPDFVLKEVQEIADSSDKIRRTRGRRGLDVLAKLQQNPKVEIRVFEASERGAPGQTVDQRIVLLAKQLAGRVVTNDFNLNKVASVQGVDVINLNDVANALRPRYLPGEQLRIKIIREGESIGQGVGYLDDGTMVVCEQAASSIGKDIEVVVTSVLQNSAGRMIFGRPLSAAGAYATTHAGGR